MPLETKPFVRWEVKRSGARLLAGSETLATVYRMGANQTYTACLLRSGYEIGFTDIESAMEWAQAQEILRLKAILSDLGRLPPKKPRAKARKAA